MIVRKYWALGRKPSEKQLALTLANIDENAKNKKQAYENIVWALLNTKEFVFNACAKVGGQP